MFSWETLQNASIATEEYFTMSNTKKSKLEVGNYLSVVSENVARIFVIANICKATKWQT